MFTSRRLGFLTALVVLGTSGAVAAEPEIGPQPRLVTSIEFASKEEKFSVTFPGKPREHSQATPANTSTKMFAVESKTGVMAVAVTDLPLPASMTQEQLDTALDSARDGQIRSAGGKLKGSKNITLGKYQGRDFTATIARPQEGQIRSKVFLVGNRLYQVMVMGTNDYVATKNADVFLGSFRITE